MTEFDDLLAAVFATDPRCDRPAELPALIADMERVLAAIEACRRWRPFLDAWRGRIEDAYTIDGNCEMQDEVEVVSGMGEAQTLARDICEALHAAFGFGLGPDEDDGPFYPTAELPRRSGAR